MLFVRRLAAHSMQTFGWSCEHFCGRNPRLPNERALEPDLFDEFGIEWETSVEASDEFFVSNEILSTLYAHRNFTAGLRDIRAIHGRSLSANLTHSLTHSLALSLAATDSENSDHPWNNGPRTAKVQTNQCSPTHTCALIAVSPTSLLLLRWAFEAPHATSLLGKHGTPRIPAATRLQELIRLASCVSALRLILKRDAAIRFRHLASTPDARVSDRDSIRSSILLRAEHNFTEVKSVVI